MRTSNPSTHPAQPRKSPYPTPRHISPASLPGIHTLPPIVTLEEHAARTRYGLPFSRVIAPIYHTGQAMFTMHPAPPKSRNKIKPDQLAKLEALYNDTTHPSTAARDALGREIGLDLKCVTIWFQNKRQTAKRLKTQAEAVAAAAAGRSGATQELHDVGKRSSTSRQPSPSPAPSTRSSSLAKSPSPFHATMLDRDCTADSLKTAAARSYLAAPAVVHPPTASPSSSSLSLSTSPSFEEPSHGTSATSRGALRLSIPGVAFPEQRDTERKTQEPRYGADSFRAELETDSSDDETPLATPVSNPGDLPQFLDVGSARRYSIGSSGSTTSRSSYKGRLVPVVVNEAYPNDVVDAAITLCCLRVPTSDPKVDLN